MNDFESTGMSFSQMNASDAGVMHLFKEFLQISASFVPHPGFGEESAAESVLKPRYSPIQPDSHIFPTVFLKREKPTIIKQYTVSLQRSDLFQTVEKVGLPQEKSIVDFGDFL